MTAPFRPDRLHVAHAGMSRPVPGELPPAVPGNFLARRHAVAAHAAANPARTIAAMAVSVTALASGTDAGRVADFFRTVRRDDLRAALTEIAFSCAADDPPATRSVAALLDFYVGLRVSAEWPWNTDAMDLARDALLDAAHDGGIDLHDRATTRADLAALFGPAERLAEPYLLPDGLAPPMPRRPSLAAIRAALDFQVSQPPVRLRLPGYGLVADLLTRPRGKHGAALAAREWLMTGRSGVIWYGHDLGLVAVGPVRTHKQAIGAFARRLHQLSRAPASAAQGE